MRNWLLLLGGLIVWTVHLFALWTIGSVFLSVPVARVIVAAATIGCLAADAVLLVILVRTRTVDELERWIRSLGTSAACLSVVAIIWQGLPALLTR